MKKIWSSNGFEHIYFFYNFFLDFLFVMTELFSLHSVRYMNSKISGWLLCQYEGNYRHRFVFDPSRFSGTVGKMRAIIRGKSPAQERSSIRGYFPHVCIRCFSFHLHHVLGLRRPAEFIFVQHSTACITRGQTAIKHNSIAVCLRFSYSLCPFLELRVRW